MGDAGIVKQIGNAVVVHVAQGDEVAFVLMLGHVGHEGFHLARFAEENLALAIRNVLLDVERNLLAQAEILHRLGDVDAHLLAQTEEMVDAVTGGENNGAVLQDADVLRAEFCRSETFDFDEGPEDNLYAVALSNIVIGGFFCGGFGLRDKYLLNHFLSCFFTVRV